jgi:hypothetical protein
VCALKAQFAASTVNCGASALTGAAKSKVIATIPSQMTIQVGLCFAILALLNA